MPRRRDEEAEETKVEEDFLEVDKPVPGQNYCCISKFYFQCCMEDQCILHQFFYHAYNSEQIMNDNCPLQSECWLENFHLSEFLYS